MDLNRCSIHSINCNKTTKMWNRYKQFYYFYECFCGGISMFHRYTVFSSLSLSLHVPCISHLYLFIEHIFFDMNDMNCNHYHTKRLKFIKICIAKIQINWIQITHRLKKNMHTYIRTYIHNCNGTTEIKL